MSVWIGGNVREKYGNRLNVKSMSVIILRFSSSL